MMDVIIRPDDEILIKTQNGKDKLLIQCNLVNKIIVSKC